MAMNLIKINKKLIINLDHICCISLRNSHIRFYEKDQGECYEKNFDTQEEADEFFDQLFLINCEGGKKWE